MDVTKINSCKGDSNLKDWYYSIWRGFLSTVRPDAACWRSRAACTRWATCDGRSSFVSSSPGSSSTWSSGAACTSRARSSGSRPSFRISSCWCYSCVASRWKAPRRASSSTSRPNGRSSPKQRLRLALVEPQLIRCKLHPFPLVPVLLLFPFSSSPTNRNITTRRL